MFLVIPEMGETLELVTRDCPDVVYGMKLEWIIRSNTQKFRELVPYVRTKQDDAFDKALNTLNNI